MFTVAGHLTYCTNIHQGENWKGNRLFGKAFLIF